MNPLDERQRRYDEAWRELIGLRGLDHATFSGVTRVWRVVMHPTFHDDVAITVTDVDAGGWIELRVLSANARAWAMSAVGYQVPMPLGSPPQPTVWETTLSAAAVEALAASIPALPLPPAAMSGVDGIHVDLEGQIDGRVHRAWCWSPSPRREPAHYAFVRVLCMIASQQFADPAAQTAIRALEPYFR
ncbi:MAG: hypothetical protein WCJ30_14280 [Deltaproteobacteria bacterium]